MNQSKNSLRGYRFTSGGGCEPIKEIGDLALIHNSTTRFIWIDLSSCPEGETERILKSEFKWHPTVLQHFRERSSRPRIAPYDGYSHITFHALRSGITGLNRALTLEIDSVLGSNYLVTVHTEYSPDLDEVFHQIPHASASLRGPDAVLHYLIQTMIDRYIPTVDALDAKLTALEQDALYRAHPPLLAKIVMARDEVLELKHALAPQVQILVELSTESTEEIRSDTRNYFRISEQRLRQIMDDLVVYKEVAQNALELYQSSITHRTNEIIRLLTVISTPLLVLTFLTGVYGMNVPLPGAHSPYAFVWICGVSVSLFIAMVYYFRKKKWF